MCIENKKKLTLIIQNENCLAFSNQVIMPFFLPVFVTYSELLFADDDLKQSIGNQWRKLPYFNVQKNFEQITTPTEFWSALLNYENSLRISRTGQVYYRCFCYTSFECSV